MAVPNNTYTVSIVDKDGNTLDTIPYYDANTDCNSNDEVVFIIRIDQPRNANGTEEAHATRVYIQYTDLDTNLDTKPPKYFGDIWHQSTNTSDKSTYFDFVFPSFGGNYSVTMENSSGSRQSVTMMKKNPPISGYYRYEIPITNTLFVNYFSFAPCSKINIGLRPYNYFYDKYDIKHFEMVKSTKYYGDMQIDTPYNGYIWNSQNKFKIKRIYVRNSSGWKLAHGLFLRNSSGWQQSK